LSRRPGIIAAFAVLALLRVDPWIRVTSDIPVADSSRLARHTEELSTPAPALEPAPLVRGTPHSSIQSTTLARPSAAESSAERRKSKAVFALIQYPWQQLGYEIAFLGPRPGYRAMTLSDKRRIEVYVRPGDRPELLAYDLAHELGHAFDLEHNDAARRDRWLRLRGIDAPAPWFGCNRCPDYDTPAGDFAETFAYLLLGPGNYRSRMARPPAAAELRALAEFCKLPAFRDGGKTLAPASTSPRN
jgi:hypothetical protein